MNLSLENFSSANQLQLRNGTSDLKFIKLILYIDLSMTVVSLILGSPIHCFVLWLIYKGKGSGIVPEFFNFNLAACELMWCLCSSSFIVAVCIPKLYKLAYFMFAIPSVGRPLFHCLICFERYLAVLHPVSFLKFKPLRYRMTCSAVVWVTVPLFGVFCMFAIQTENMYLFLKVLMPFNLLFFSFKLFCLLAVLKALKFPKAAQRMNMNRNKEARQKLRKAMSQILIITVSMLSQYIPVVVHGIIFETLSSEDFQILWCASFVISSIMSFVKPVLHIFRYRL